MSDGHRLVVAIALRPHEEMEMDYRALLAVNTSGYVGYPLETAIEHASALGYRRVEIAAMYGIADHIKQEEMNAAKAAWVRRLLDANGLDSYAFSAHLFLHRPDALDLFLPRMDFAKEIGATLINTKAGPPSELPSFLRNMETLVRHAEDIEIVIGLETHGDIVNYGMQAVEAVQRFGSDHVILNYDLGNVLVGNRGLVDPANDFISLLDHIGHVHLKDAFYKDGIFHMCAIGQGEIDCRRVLATLKALPSPMPLTVDLPLAIAISETSGVIQLDPKPLEEIDTILRASMDYVGSMLFD